MWLSDLIQEFSSEHNLRTDLEQAEIFRPLLKPSRYKGAYGGRGSGKSHFFAGLLVDEHIRSPGFRTVCIREVQHALRESAKQLIEDKIQQFGVGHLFEIQREEIRSQGGGVILFQGMREHSAESLKSFERFNRAWIEEAQTLSERSFELLRPTIRAEGSEIWASWNPRRKDDAVDKFFRGEDVPSDAVCVKANWRDNPWFPNVLDNERKLDQDRYPERYGHIWEGEYATALKGAYFAKLLHVAADLGRIGNVAADPLLPLRAFWDLGGSGAQADAMAIWICQFVGQEIRILDYIEGVGQVLGYYTDLLRQKGYQRAICHLPHDGVNSNAITGKRYSDHLSDAGFDVPPPMPNQGKGAAMMRVEAVRRILPRCWFNEASTEAGRSALGYYHERRDDGRQIGLGPEHDWSSHAADAFGLMALTYEEPGFSSAFNRDYSRTFERRFYV
jgi:phage terminase large subunit